LSAKQNLKAEDFRVGMKDMEKVKELIAEGLSRSQIAHKLGLTYHRIRTVCDEIGIPRRSSGGRPPRDQSNALINLLDQCRFYATKAGLYFRTARGTHYFYDQPIATFTDVHIALAFVKSRTRREATRQLHRMNGRTPAVPRSLGAAAAIDRRYNHAPVFTAAARQHNQSLSATAYFMKLR
jgi:hypothetical protein